MQFLKDGPDIPDALLQAHEEGSVVFFCGAGISYPAGLPGFKGLVDKVYKEIGEVPNQLESDVYERGQFDTVLDLLEKRVAGQRSVVRNALWQSLKPNFRKKNATKTHEALLKLACDSEGMQRIVTTNFDRVFERAASRQNQKLNSFIAPMLPIPKKSRWDGLVYLHGLLPKKEDYSALNRLVFTSGDFGLAYLTERWASRFVSELFKNYIICFIGYSINDPVLRYMMDALAADRMQGEAFPDAYALGDYEVGNEEKTKNDWKAKGVIPILYNVEPGSHNHSNLHGTLDAWAKTYEDGTLGKERIITNHALSQPSLSTVNDDYVGRVIWALSDPSGLPAKQFAEFNPAPTLNWLDAFTIKRFTYKDLSRYGVLERGSKFANLKFSLLDRPSSSSSAPWVSIRNSLSTVSEWDNVMHHLARWMIRHLNDPSLVLWLVSYGGGLNKNFARMVEEELRRFKELEKEDRIDELKEIKTNSPNAIPDEPMKIIWRILLTNRVATYSNDFSIYDWTERVERDGFTTSLKLELRDLLAPKVEIKKTFNWHSDEIKKPYDWEIILTERNIKEYISEIKIVIGEHNLGFLFDDFHMLLLDALNLKKELGGADKHSDHSSWDLPSISIHHQNKGFQDWVVLIELQRDSWLQVYSSDIEDSRNKALSWFRKPFPIFKRLALFAASYDNVIEPNVWVKWLCEERGWWLWSIETQRETMRLIVIQGHNLKKEDQKLLENTILSGLPRDMFMEDTGDDFFQKMDEHSIWLHLAKLMQGKVSLGIDAKKKYEELSQKHPKWELDPNDKDEFSLWMSGTGDPDYESSKLFVSAPNNRKELAKWLKEPLPSNRFDYEDNWQEVCKNRFFLSFIALYDLALENEFPVERWKTALQIWSKGKNISLYWKYVAPILKKASDLQLFKVSHSISRLLKAVSKHLIIHENIFCLLISRIIFINKEAKENADVTINSAINNPIGIVTEALFNYWFSTSPQDNDRLQGDFYRIFNQICTSTLGKLDFGKVILASQTIALYRVDSIWSEKNLLPLFDWNRDKKVALIMWQGFLWSPRIYMPLLEKIKVPFLETTLHLKQLGECSRQYAQFFTYVALEHNDIFSESELRKVLVDMPIDSLEEVAIALTQALVGAAEKKEEYWKKRILPFWVNTWPKSRERSSSRIVESLVKMCIGTKNEFPNALSTINGQLKPIEHPDYLVRLLEKSDLPRIYPDEALHLLGDIIDGSKYPPTKLRDCLNCISATKPDLQQDKTYIRLNEYLRQNSR